MLNKVGKAMAGIVLLGAATSAAHSTSFGITLSLQVPVLCTVKADAAGASAADAAAVQLGSLHEYCNAPRGYDLVVHYTPGTLKGMTLIAGDNRVQLDGSGQAVVARLTGPTVKDRNIEAIPGPDGFDADHLDFDTVVTPF